MVTLPHMPFVEMTMVPEGIGGNDEEVEGRTVEEGMTVEDGIAEDDGVGVGVGVGVDVGVTG